MTATEGIEQFKSLPPEERGQAAAYLLSKDKSWIPDSFGQGMADAEAGKLVDTETALNETPPSDS